MGNPLTSSLTVAERETARVALLKMAVYYLDSSDCRDSHDRFMSAAYFEFVFQAMDGLQALYGDDSTDEPLSEAMDSVQTLRALVPIGRQRLVDGEEVAATVYWRLYDAWVPTRLAALAALLPRET